MKKINIPNSFSNRTKTLIRFYNYIFINSIQPSVEGAEAFLDKYIPEAKEYIIEHTGGDLKELRNIRFVSERELEMEETERRKYNFESYAKFYDEFDMDDVACNLCTILEQIDYENDKNKELMDAIELGEYEEAYNILRDKIMSLITISNGVTNYVMTIARDSDNKLDTSKHYVITPDICKGIIAQRDIQLSKNINKLIGKTDCFASDILLFFELITVKHKTDILKFILALVCIYKSFEYEQYMRDYAKMLIEILQEIFFGGEIHKVYIQMKQYDQHTPIEERGSQGGTTRFGIIFSAYNDDIYYLRIDLPHKGEMKLHLNLHECVKQKMIPMGYPLDISVDNIRKLREVSGSSFDELFFMVCGKLWFRTEFEKKIKLANIEEANKKELRALFEEQSHYIIDNVLENKNFVLFFDELKEYVMSFDLAGSVLVSYDKDTLDIASEVRKIRRLQIFNIFFAKEIMKEGNEPIIGNRDLWGILEALKFNRQIEKESFFEFSLYECLDYLNNYIA